MSNFRIQAVIARIVRVLEFVYAVALLLVMFHFPVAKLWLNLLNSGQQNDTPMLGLQATVLVIHVPALVAVSANPRILSVIRSELALKLMALLFCTMGLSTIWSELPGRTFWDWSVLSMSVVGSTFLGLRLDARQFFVRVALSIQIALLLSEWAIYREWDESVQLEGGYWQGIFGNRNTLAPLAGFGAVLSLLLIWSNLTSIHKSGHSRRFVEIVLTVLSFSNCLFVLLKTGSLTSFAGIALAAVFFLLLMSFRRFSPWLARRKVKADQALFASSLGLTVLTLTIVTVFSNSISGHLGRYSGLSGRLTYWRVGLEKVLERPLLGWGWNSAWLSDSFPRNLPSVVLPYRWSHSAWIEFALGMGLVGGVLVLAWATALLRQLSHGIGPKSQDGILLPVFGFVIVLMTMESVSWIFHWFFALTVGISVLVAKSADQEFCSPTDRENR